MLTLASLASCDAPYDPVPPVTEQVDHLIVSLSCGEPGWVLTKYALLNPDRVPVDLPSSERGHRLSAAWVDPDGTLWVGYDRGAVYRSTDGGLTWTGLWDGFETPVVPIVAFSMRRPVPRQFTRTPDGDLYLATVGRGVLRWDEDASRWQDATWLLDLVDGNVSPLSWSVTPWGDGGIAAGYVSPRGIIPPWAVDLFGQQVRTVGAVGETPVQVETPAAVRFVVDIATRNGKLVAATLGNGLWEHDGEAWTSLGPDPAPPDLWAVDVNANGDIAAITLAGDVWRRRGSTWIRVRCGGDGQPGADVRWVGRRRLLVGVGTELTESAPTAVECPDRGGATVLLAFSQHTNLYHSYRGDTNSEDGFGKDIRIIRSTIEIFDRHPQFHNDWDIENLFSLDDWLPLHAPDILDDVKRRVNNGTDGIRLMSWNNGLMACEPAAEFEQSVVRGTASLEAFVPGAWTPGVQPQENTYTPAHPKLYRDTGIDWITLFYSATAFTSFRNEVPLTLAEAHGVLTLESDLVPDTLPLIPVYHHADVMDHGGLANWLRQLHQNLTGTVVLAIHFDADSETWEGFEAELEGVEALEADWVVPMRLQDILTAVPPVGSVTIRRDLADGAFDGFASWTEKPVNHRFYTRVVRSRLAERRARALAAGPLAAGVQADLDAAMDGRLRTLSTTHFGLANPALHPEREAAGEAVSRVAETRAASALAAVIADASPLGNTVLNPETDPVTFLIPVGDAMAGGGGSPAAVRTLESPDGARRWLVGTVGGGDRVTLAPTSPGMTTGAAPSEGWGPATGLGTLEVQGPRIRLREEDHRPVVTERQLATGPGGEVLTVLADWDQGTGGSVRYDWITFFEDPGAVWVEVTVTYPSFAEDDHRWWDDVAPLELVTSAADQWTVVRPLVTGEVADYTVAGHFDALNQHAADGWLQLLADTGSSGPSLTVFAPMRSAPAFLPIRFALDDSGQTTARLVPFGALWGEQLDHHPTPLLGAGMAEYSSRLVAPQLQSTAAAWNGETICFLLRIQADTTETDHPTLSHARDGVLLLDATRTPTLRQTCL